MFTFGTLSSSLSSSCTNKEDGYYWLKLLNGNYPIVKIKCSNEYMMLDLSIDENLKYYFSSFTYWHYALVGPTNDDHISWDEWFLPAKYDNIGTGLWSHSDDCSVCNSEATTQLSVSPTTSYEETVAKEIDYSEQGYYMSGNMYGCFWWYRGIPSCDLDWDSYECNSCAAGPVFNLEYHIGMCTSIIESVHREAETDHLTCSKSTYNKKPSLGINSKYCMCYKPTTDIVIEETETYDELVLESNRKSINLGNEKITNTGLTSKNNIVYLTQNDFKYGTYRIKNSGTYIISEDIIFDFNAGDENDPKMGDWWPTLDQSDDYPGVGDYRDAFFLGFFAGITVECNDVIIDLNGKTLKQNEAFYHQQRWFSHIELASAFFQPGQGPGYFGSNFTSSEQVTIKNGILDLSSHFGIHGNRNKDVTIENLIVKNFEIAGIHLNGFDTVSISNVEVGPSSQQVHLSGNYGHIQWILPRLLNVLNEYPDAALTFDGDRTVTLQDTYDRLEEMLSRAYKYAMFNIGDESYDSDDDIWIETKKWLINENGIPDGGTMHGIFLNSPGANVFSIGLSLWKSNNINMNNVYIHDLKNAPRQVVRMQNGVNFQLHSFNGPFPIMQCSVLSTGEEIDLTQELEYEDIKYKGSTITDMWYLFNHYETKWGPLQNIILDEDLVNWAIDGTPLGTDEETNWKFACNADVMLHSVKGVMGLRFDGVTNAVIDDIKIERIVNVGAISEGVCGEMENAYSRGHFLQVTPAQSMGYSGTYAYGIIMAQSEASIGKLEINDIISGNGISMGVGIWHNNVVSVTNTWNINDIRSGDLLLPNIYDYTSRPTPAGEACSVFVYAKKYTTLKKTFLEGVDYENSIVNINDNVDILTTCVRGEVLCRDTDQQSFLGTINECEYKSTEDWPTILNVKPLYSYPMDDNYDDDNKDDDSNNEQNSHLLLSLLSNSSISTILLILLFIVPFIIVVAIIIYNSYKKYFSNNNNNNNNDNNKLYKKLPVIYKTTTTTHYGAINA